MLTPELLRTGNEERAVRATAKHRKRSEWLLIAAAVDWMDGLDYCPLRMKLFSYWSTSARRPDPGHKLTCGRNLNSILSSGSDVPDLDSGQPNLESNNRYDHDIFVTRKTLEKLLRSYSFSNLCIAHILRLLAKLLRHFRNFSEKNSTVLLVLRRTHLFLFK